MAVDEVVQARVDVLQGEVYLYVVGGEEVGDVELDDEVVVVGGEVEEVLRCYCE